MTANDPTFFQDQTTKAAREGEVPNANFDDGLNRGGSNAPGIGIGTQAGQVAPPSWSLLDQNLDARVPQVSQHIGGNATIEGVSGKGTVPINVADQSSAPDYDDTVSLTSLATGWQRDPV